MTTPLRLGFLLSGLFHVVVVAAFSLSPEQEIPLVDGPGQLTLRLALFKPAQAAPTPPLAVARSQPEAQTVAEVAPPRPPEQQMEIAAPVEPRQHPVVEPVEPKPRPVVERVNTIQPVVKKRSKVTPAKNNPSRARPVEVSPAPSYPSNLTAVAKPRPVSASFDTQKKQHYLAALAAKINRSKYYPLGSRRRGEEGRVVVRFVVQKNGDLTDFTVVESSGSRRLDSAAIKTLRRVSPFRPIPDALDRDHWSVSVPIAFSLGG